ncbi:GGDEF domain-containing protein [Vallitalea okinawensis]|uniref:GGDEF domain-containing protein n=1 Tax=Vallitalea okinawensis TaxID=2078660 RepID=UPI0013008821|nr:GGDEF domain-containing protein [Vallitalea okinawensis]
MKPIDNNRFYQKFKGLFIPITKDLKEEFYSTIAKENFFRVIIISIVYMLFEVVIILSEQGLNPAFENKLTYFVFIFQTLSILIAFWVIFNKKPINGLILQVIIALYCILLVYWSVIISLDQVNRTGSITMFILTLTGTSALFYRRSLVTLVTNIGLYLYFQLNMRLLIELPISEEMRNLPPGPGKPPVGTLPPGHMPLNATMHPDAFFLKDIYIYIADAFLMTVICCVLGVIVYRLRLKVFLEHKALENLALKDSMTNLLNHKTICDTLKNEINRSARYSQPVSILMTDIDHFKQINDTYGHQVGDQVIIRIAKLLSEYSRQTDYVGRYGGEEFLVVLTNTNEEDAKKFGERIRTEIEKMDFGLPHQVTVSGGVKTYSNESAEEMIKLADSALYQAKKKGRNCIVSA